MPKLAQHFKKGDLVKISRDGRDNEGYAAFVDLTLRVTSVATKYMPAKEFYQRKKEGGVFNMRALEDYHPGFDEGSGAALYDLEVVNGEPLPVSLYDWELEHAKGDWTVVHHATGKVIAECDSEEAAVQYIGTTLNESDPQGVHNGDYTIDGPAEEKQ